MKFDKLKTMHIFVTTGHELGATINTNYQLGHRRITQ